ncbi:MAG TPA: S8 family peptidase [Micromonosporaceae bacterium]
MHNRQASPLRRARNAAAIAITAALAATLTAAPAHAAEGTILGADSAHRVAGSFIVVLKPAASVESVARGLTNRHGGKIKHIYTSALRGFAIEADERSARRLAADSAVAYVEADQTVHATGTQPNPPSWGLDRIDQRNLPLDSSYTYPNTASNVRAYIIDTGIRTTHTDFGGRASWGTNTTGDGNNTDCNGHGTHVASTTGGSSYGVAKQAQLIAVKVLNCQGSGTISGVIAGVDWVTNNAVKPAVANMSLGGGASSTLDNAVANSIASGITYAVAAGNDNANACNYSPARTATAITVGATTSSDARASFSNYGTCLDIFAPGSSITAAWNSSDTATNTISGTSMASPHAAGAAALVLSANPSWSPQQVRDYLVNNATDGVVTNPGSGSPNKLLYVVNASGGNDFSISVSPTSGSVTQGGSVSATVNTTVTSGSPQTVTLSASGLPSGATASFNPSSVTAGNSSTMTISTSSSTPTGTYTVTITGSAASGTRSTTYTLTVNGSGGGCSSPGQKLANPGFESGSTGWTADSGVIGQWGAYGQPPRSGTWNAWHNGYGASNSDYVYQNVTLPAGCSTYTLSFWLHIDTAETTTTTAYDTFRVQVLSADGSQVLATLATYSNLDAASGYSLKSFNLSAYAGQTIRIRWYGVEDFIYQTSFVIDDTAVNVS